MVYFFKNGNNENAANKLIIGTKNSEWVKCLWYSTESNESFSDCIKISRSGTNPPTSPQIAATLTLFLLDTAQARLAPNIPWVTGSILSPCNYLIYIIIV